MAAKKKPTAKKTNSTDIKGTVSGSGEKRKQVMKAASDARRRAGKYGDVFGPTTVTRANTIGRAIGDKGPTGISFTATTPVYSRGGTGKGTTPKRAVVSESKEIYKSLPDVGRKTSVSRKLNKSSKKKSK